MRPTSIARFIALQLAALVVLAAVFPHNALAEWDVQTFIKLRDEAQKLYDAESYEGALPRYRVLETMIDEALSADEIPADQQPAAREALEIARYQIGRCLQLTNECGEAVETYTALLGTAESKDIELKTEARLTESLVCHASGLASADETRDAADVVQALEGRLGAEVDATAGSDEVQKLLDETRKNAGASVTEIRNQIVKASLGRGDAAIDEDHCDAARDEESFLTSFAPGASSEIAVLSDRIERECKAAPPGLVDTSSAAPPVGAIVLMSVGGAALISDAVYEFVFVNQKVEDLKDADTECQRAGMQCGDVLSLEDELKTDRIVSISLLGGGGALLLGGVIWWIVDASSSDSDAEPPESAAFVSPRSGGAVIGFSWTLQ